MVFFISVGLLISLFLAVVYGCYKIQFSYWSRQKTVPSVPGKIFSGNIKEFLTFRTNFAYHLKTIYDDPKFAGSPVVGVYGLYKPSLLVRDPELIKSMLVRDFDYFRNRFSDMDLRNDPIGARGIFFTRYSIWKEMRTKLSPLFTSVKLKNMFCLIQNVAENMEHHVSRQKTAYRVEMKDFCARYMTDIVATTLLGFQSNSLENPSEQLNKEIRRLTDFNVKLALNYVVALFVPKLASILGAKLIYPETEEFLKGTISEAVRERESNSIYRNDLIDLFVKLRKEAVELGKNMKEFMQCLIAQAGVFMVGGFETSSTTMSNALLELAKHPELQNKLKRQIQTTMEQKTESKLSYEDMNNLEYIDMVIYETLRLYPVFPILERVHCKPPEKMQSYSLQPHCDFSLPDGMSIFISTYGLNYDPKYWSNPTKFDPERFSSANRDTLNSPIYMPFGIGPHNCIGIRLAMLQLKCGLLYLLKDHHVRLCEDTLIKPEFDAKSILLQVKGGIHLEIVKDNKTLYWCTFNTMWLFLLIVPFTLLSIFWFKAKFNYWSHLKVPHAKKSPLSGNIFDFLFTKTNFAFHLKSIYDDPKFADEAAVGVFGVINPGLLIRDPNLVKQMLIKDFDKFSNRAVQCDTSHDDIGGLSMFFAPYSYWKDIRSKICPVFSSGKLKSMYPLLQTVANRLEENLQQRGDMFAEDLKHLSTRYTTDATSTTILGFQSNALLDANDAIHLETLKISKFNMSRAFSFMCLTFMPQLAKLFRVKACFRSTYAFVKSTVDFMINDRQRSGHKRNDVIDIYMKLKQEAAIAGEEEMQTLKCFYAQTCSILLGGVETSATTISSALFELAKNPEIQERLRKELQNAFLNGHGEISYESITSLEYLGMVIDETLRKYPGLPLLDRRYKPVGEKDRYSLKPYYDYELPKGMPVYISNYALHYDSKYWPNPTTFDPERFSLENRQNIEPMSYLPFGNGPRNCIGYRLGLLQIKTALAHFLKNHRVQVCEQTNLEPQFDPKAFILQQKGGVYLEVVRDNMFDNAFKLKSN
ncbi:uncharacterized protein LOC106092109 [Stomoxys calcitrans]|uniref:uncharacterized protein LOC106092109 n=1 Tax=Stomoxys calcitrans TaxID=35570 RepID=UPI0027E2AC1E|nr:uncharacterized protein LOC106092109 [Stomoxys calcitrans]